MLKNVVHGVLPLQGKAPCGLLIGNCQRVNARPKMGTFVHLAPRRCSSLNACHLVEVSRNTAKTWNPAAGVHKGTPKDAARPKGWLPMRASWHTARLILGTQHFEESVLWLTGAETGPVCPMDHLPSLLLLMSPLRAETSCMAHLGTWPCLPSQR